MSNGSSPKVNVSIYGIGNFGYAILKHLDNKKGSRLSIKAYDYDMDVVNSLAAHKSHPYFHKSVRISRNIEFVNNPEALLGDCDVLVLAVTSDATRAVLENIVKHAKDGVVIVNAAKALDYETGKRLSEVVEEELQGHRHTYATLAGGTIARDLFKHEPLGIDIACSNDEVLGLLQSIFQSENLSVYTTNDVVGVEYAGSYKNMVAILAGIVKGLGLSYGSETHIISRTAHSIGQACVNDLGSSPDTFSIGSQSWGNDLWMSCTGNTRNRELGILLGRGVPVDEALATMHAQHKSVEGVHTLATIDKVPAIKAIPSINLLHKLIVDKSIQISDVKNHLVSYGLTK